MTIEHGKVRVVSNTTPVSNSLRLGRLGLLGQAFGKIAIPTQVAEELDRGEHVLGKWRDAAGAEGLVVVAPNELAGRKVAVHHRLQLTGTLGVLTDAKRRGHVPAVRPLLDALANEGYHVSSALRTRVLRDAGESD